METIIIDDTLTVGVDEIDDDHGKLVELFNILGRSVAAGDSADYIDAVLEELISCTEWHFRHEERLMLLHKYKAFDEHKTEHHDLIDSVRALQQKFYDQNKQLTNEDIEFLSDWLTGHILGHDMKLGFYLMEIM